jgi:adenylate kinase
VKRRIVLLGPPASGKGTIADGLRIEFGLPIVSPGALLRAERAAGTSLGLDADARTKQGQLIDDDTINAIVGNWVRKQNGAGFVFDGYPRTLGQATALDSMLAERKEPLDLVILLEASLETLRHRVESRAICDQCGNIVSVGVHVATLDSRCPRCGGTLSRRSDDSVETLEHRLREYSAKTEPLIQFYEDRDLLQRVNTERPPDAVFEQVRTIVE